MGAEARVEVTGADEAREGRRLPAEGHAVRGRSRFPAVAALDRLCDRGRPGGRPGVLREEGARVEGSVGLVGLLCRTCDPTAGGARGVQGRAPLLGGRLGVEPRLIGSPSKPRAARFEDDLRDSRGCLLEAGGQVDDALSGGNLPILLAGDCSICLTTLPTALRYRPDAKVLWLDAHG